MSQEKVNIYNRQIKRLSRHIKQIEAKSEQIGNWRLLLVVGGGIPLVLLFFSSYSALFWLLLSVVAIAFIFLIATHRRIEQSLRKHRIWRAIKQEHRARMLLDWKRIPDPALNLDEHPLETDFDLRELHRLLNTASSQSGTMRLRQWLVNTNPSLAIIEQRQRLVKELTSRPAFRDKLTLNARISPAQVRKKLDTHLLADWLHSDISLAKIDFWLVILAVLALTNMIAFGLSQAGTLSSVISGIAWGAYALVYVSRVGLMNQYGSDDQILYDVLLRLRSIMQHLESYPYANMPEVRKLCSPLLEAKPSQHIKRLMGTLAAGNLKGNPILWIALNAIMPWDLFFIRQLHQQKEQLATYMPQWLDVWHEIEALNSLANFAYHNENAVTANLQQSHIFNAEKIAHPLLSQSSRVSNNFSVQSVGELAILTGSNMSGKSSFLRTLGVNLVMAYAGGVVIADSFDVGVFRLFSCIRVTDSLDDGISYFYAEVKRLKDLLNALESDDDLPLFFVIDEIFRGTNNRERLIGSRSYINALAGANGIGLIATHDLELTQLTDNDPQIRNLHFREHVDDGRMVFDYILREGASPTTNALQIMAMEGLPVEENTIIKQAKHNKNYGHK